MSCWIFGVFNWFDGRSRAIYASQPAWLGFMNSCKIKFCRESLRECLKIRLLLIQILPCMNYIFKYLVFYLFEIVHEPDMLKYCLYCLLCVLNLCTQFFWQLMLVLFQHFLWTVAICLMVCFKTSFSSVFDFILERYRAYLIFVKRYSKALSDYLYA